MVLWRPTRPFRLTPKKDVLFIIGDWNAKVGSQTSGVTQIWFWNTEWSRAKANRVLPRECTGHSKYPLPTTQEKTLHLDITRWSTSKSDWLYSLQPKMEKLYQIRSDQLLSRVWLCNPMNRSTPGLPVHHQLPEFTQTPVHRVSDAIQPSHPLSSPSSPAPNPSQNQSLFQWVNSSYEVAKVLEFQL